jgi:DNA-binding LytR/AlgR family response regulator
MNIKCLIVDDEALALDVLDNYIRRTDFLQLEARCRSAVEALSVLNEKRIDLVFLDIQMPGITGIQLLQALSQKPDIILTTAHPDYALQGFELEVLDYLLKPIAYERFLKAVNRHLSKRQNGPQQGSIAQEEADSFFVRSEKKMVRINLNDLLFVESLRNYVVLHLADQSEVKTMSTISHIEERLPDSRFIRIHRSFIVAVNRIRKIGSRELQLEDRILPIGRNYRNFVHKKLDKWGLL